jgi:hypothetical protein
LNGVLPKSSKFNARHDIFHILSPLPEILAPYQDDRSRHVVIHADSARPHCGKTVPQVWINRLSGEDFILRICQISPLKLMALGHLKEVLQGSSFDEPDELLSAIQEILAGVGRETLDAGFQQSMIRLPNYIDGNG